MHSVGKTILGKIPPHHLIIIFPHCAMERIRPNKFPLGSLLFGTKLRKVIPHGLVKLWEICFELKGTPLLAQFKNETERRVLADCQISLS